MLEYRTVSTSEEFLESIPPISTQSDCNFSLAKLWEVIVRTNRLPDGISETFLYDAVRDKLRDPEREVRQHALRVLMDLIPVTQTSNLDNEILIVLPEILKNLGHSSPSLRKSSLDSLKKYLKFSKNYNFLMKELLGSSEHFTAVAPFLVSTETDDRTIKLVIDQLWDDLNNPIVSQEAAAKALARLRFNLGDERFKDLMGVNKYHCLQEICEIYGLPIDYSDEDNDTLLNGEDLIEDRVILETEITLKTGPPITMKIHEESRSNSSMDDFIEDSSKFGVVKILGDDSESDFEEVARRTPRKVRFGGESVKLRTPESDSSNPDESSNTLCITVKDAVNITTRKSLIPVRITSLPSTPLKNSKTVAKKRLYMSAPNLRSLPKTKIPLKANSNLVKKLQIKDAKMEEKAKPLINIKSASSDQLFAPKTFTPEPASSQPTSPVPSHKEIEVFHNLTRSPVRQKRPNTVDSTNLKGTKTFSDQNNTFNSFKLYNKEESVTAIEISETYDSFKIFKLDQEQKINEIIPPVDVRTKINNDLKSSTDTISVGESQIFHTDEATNLEHIPSEEKNEYDSFKVCSDHMDCVDIETSQDTSLIKDERKNGGLDLNRQWQISSFSSDETLWNKSEALDNLVTMLKQPNTCENLEPGPTALLFEALFACQHLDKLHFLAADALALMVKGVRSEVIEQCIGRLSLGICKIGAPFGVSLALLLMKKCLPKMVLGEIMDRCFAHKTREGALQILMASARLLPRNELELLKMTEFAASTLRDRRRRVRHAALETLATIAQLTSNAEVLDVVAKVTEVSPDHHYLLRVVRTR